MQFEESEHKNEAATIIRKLAMGYDPHSGEPLGADHLVQRPEIIRALMLAAHSLAPAQAKSGTGELPARAGSSWSKEEDMELRELFASRMSVRDIAASFERTRGSITSRLVRLGLVESKDEARRLGDPSDR